MKTGVVYVKVRLQLEQDISEKEASELVSEMDYEFNDPRIQNAEIVESGTHYDDC